MKAERGERGLVKKIKRRGDRGGLVKGLGNKFWECEKGCAMRNLSEMMPA